jgi:predicted phosphoribosyltransferase
MATKFWSRREAGTLLARKLRHYYGAPAVVVLGLPRGGVPVAFDVARALRAPLDVLIVRKLSLPGYPELAMGAVASGGVRVLNGDLIAEFEVPDMLLGRVIAEAEAEVSRREHTYRGWTPPADLRGRTVIMVDDGLATGATMRAAVEVARRRGAARVVVGAPVSSVGARRAIACVADEIICMATPEPFTAVGDYYDQFPQLTDSDVRDLLDAAARAIQSEESPADYSFASS